MNKKALIIGTILFLLLQVGIMFHAGLFAIGLDVIDNIMFYTYTNNCMQKYDNTFFCNYYGKYMTYVITAPMYDLLDGGNRVEEIKQREEYVKQNPSGYYYSP